MELHSPERARMNARSRAVTPAHIPRTPGRASPSHWRQLIAGRGFQRLDRDGNSTFRVVPDGYSQGATKLARKRLHDAHAQRLTFAH